MMAFLQVYFNGELKFTAPLQKTETRIGRAADNDVVIDNRGVSGHHAVIVRDQDSFYIVDNKSTNGVFVNGLSVSQAPLAYGDEITIFKHKLRFVAVDLTMGKGITTHNAIVEDETVFVKSEQLLSIVLQQQKEKQKSYLLQTNGDNKGKRWLLLEQHFEIGKGKGCHLQVDGWLVPQLSAVISRQSEGHYLIPKGGRVYCNEQLLKEPVKLKNHDRLKIGGLSLVFQQL